MNKIICGDALASLKTLESGIVQTCCTSPPYFGLRDYGTEQIIPARSDMQDCQHEWVTLPPESQFNAYCKHCDAFKKDQQIGLEDTPEAYIARLVEVFREVKRVLRDDGTCWIVIGDSFAGSGKGYGGKDHGKLGKHAHEFLPPPSISELPPKSLMGIPWRLAFALQDDGWILRMDCIWHKPNCMPESVEDRPTKAHEYIFLLSKSERYFYDNEAIKEPVSEVSLARISQPNFANQTGGAKDYRNGINPNRSMRQTLENFAKDPSGRNKRSVWTVSTSPYSGAHFAVFPPKLIEPCILAGSSPRACEHCGAPWERVTSQEEVAKDKPSGKPWLDMPSQRPDGYKPTGLYSPTRNINHTIGWQPTCSHSCEGTAQCIVLDPFAGAGTTALVSIQHHRDYIAIELNPEYVKLINDRIAVVQPDLWDTAGILSVVRKRIDEATPEEADEIIARLDALIEERTA